MSQEARQARELTEVKALNDYVAIYKLPVLQDSGLELDDNVVSQLSNEGVVVGVGQDAEGVVNLGDYVIFRPNRYTELHPESGGYMGQTVIIARKLDLMIKKAIPENPFTVKTID